MLILHEKDYQVNPNEQHYDTFKSKNSRKETSARVHSIANDYSKENETSDYQTKERVCWLIHLFANVLIIWKVGSGTSFKALILVQVVGCWSKLARCAVIPLT